MQPEIAALATRSSAHEKSVRESLINEIGERVFDHWFRGRTRFCAGEGELLVLVGSPFLLTWLQKKFREPLAQVAGVCLGPAARVRFEVDARIASPVTRPDALSERGCDARREENATLAPSPSGSPDQAVPPRECTKVQVAPRAGRRLADLADFVAGPCNALALEAVRQVCARPESAKGPLFIYGPVGTGKTHLLEGVCRALRGSAGRPHVILLSAEQFTNYFTQAYREHSLPAFRQRFRTVDVLLVDDVDFLDAKRVVQEEFLHTYQQLESHSRLVVMTANRHPRLLTRVSDELVTRFLSGMVCRLEPPDLETREQIVSARGALLEMDIAPEALRYVAGRFSGNVRELEGALNCLKVHSSMSGRRVTAAVAREVLADLERDCLRVVRMADVERVVCHLFGIESAELRSACRARSVSQPRMLAMYLARRFTGSAYSEIGRYFGGRNHATVISAERRISGWLQTGATLQISSRTWQLAQIVDILTQQLQAG
jgi:chromosomal replication initiator protein